MIVDLVVEVNILHQLYVNTPLCVSWQRTLCVPATRHVGIVGNDPLTASPLRYDGRFIRRSNYRLAVSRSEPLVV